MMTLIGLTWAQARCYAKCGYTVFREQWTETLRCPLVDGRVGTAWYRCSADGTIIEVVQSTWWSATNFTADDWCAYVDDVRPACDGYEYVTTECPTCKDIEDITCTGSGDVHWVFAGGRLALDDNCPNVGGGKVCLIGSSRIDGTSVEVWYGQTEYSPVPGGYIINSIRVVNRNSITDYYIADGEHKKDIHHGPPVTIPAEQAITTILRLGPTLTLKSCQVLVTVLPRVAGDGFRYFEMAVNPTRFCGAKNVYGGYGAVLEYFMQPRRKKYVTGSNVDGWTNFYPGSRWSKASISAVDSDPYSGPILELDRIFHETVCEQIRKTEIQTLDYSWDPLAEEKKIDPPFFPPPVIIHSSSGEALGEP